VRQFIRDINAETKLTVILTTHDMNDIEALTDRVVLIGKGQILHDGSFAGIKRGFGGEMGTEEIIAALYREHNI
jgi:ABC-2 type transport system ATP-binding protein